jgi:hypothetical protein
MAFLLKSIEREAKLNALGRLVFYQHAIQLLCNRLYLERDRQTDSRISGRNIRKDAKNRGFGLSSSEGTDGSCLLILTQRVDGDSRF